MSCPCLREVAILATGRSLKQRGGWITEADSFDEGTSRREKAPLERASSTCCTKKIDTFYLDS